MKIIDIIASRLLLIFSKISEKFPGISEKFSEILNFWKIYNPNHDTSVGDFVNERSINFIAVFYQLY